MREEGSVNTVAEEGPSLTESVAEMFVESEAGRHDTAEGEADGGVRERSFQLNSSSAIMSKKEQVLVIEPPIGLSDFIRASPLQNTLNVSRGVCRAMI